MIKGIFEFFQGKRLIDYQVLVYINWIERHGLKSTFDYEWIKYFIDRGSIYDIYAVTNCDIDRFMASVTSGHSEFVCKEMKKAVTKFVRFYRARTKNVCYNTEMKRPIGRTPQIEKIKQVKLLRDKAGLSFREIAQKLGIEDIKTVYRWYIYPEKRLNLYVKRTNGQLSPERS